MENIVLKSFQKFHELLVPTQILIEYMIIITVLLNTNRPLIGLHGNQV